MEILTNIIGDFTRKKFLKEDDKEFQEFLFWMRNKQLQDDPITEWIKDIYQQYNTETEIRIQFMVSLKSGIFILVHYPSLPPKELRKIALSLNLGIEELTSKYVLFTENPVKE